MSSTYRMRNVTLLPLAFFGGKTVVLGGDFRQTLPVKKGASKLEIIASSIVESHLWNHFNVCILKENMRLLQPGKDETEQRLACSFASWLLDIGNGKIGEPAADDIQNSSWITVPQRYCIPDDNNGLSNLINFIYDKDTLQHPTAQELQHKAIVCPRNDTADIINTEILKMVDGNSIIYRSSDEAVPLGNDRGATELLYPMEYLNTLQFSGFPPHELELKVGIPIMLLRNVNLQGGMCNGTRMIIKKLWSKLIEAEGNVIQANMGTDAIAYFNSILQAGAAYRISHFTGDVIELTLWDETAKNFQKAEYESMQKPVIIAVSSCKVTEYAHNLQLTATSATFYYLNPEIPELGDLIAE
ncbi:DNA helicase [Tanacetum coccineum]